MRRTALTCVLALASAARADTFDLAGATLDGDNPYTFIDDALGLVTLTYSGNFKNEGLVTNWGSTTTIGLGERGTGSGVLNVSWETAITSLDVRAYDLDLGEYDDFTISDGATLSLVTPNPHGPGSPLDGLRLHGSGADLPNGAADNYALVRIAGAGLTSFTVEFARPGSSGGGHSILFGDAIVPTPAAALLLIMGGCSVSRRRV